MLRKAVLCLAISMLTLGFTNLAAAPVPTVNDAAQSAAVALFQSMGGNAVTTQLVSASRGLIINTLMSRYHAAGQAAYSAADEILLPAMKAHIGEYEAMTAQIYAQHLSVEEMVTLSSFYRTSVGQKWVVLQPLIFQQTVSAGILWVENVEDKVIEQHRAELLKRGIEK
jgi:hypothetical protein